MKNLWFMTAVIVSLSGCASIEQKEAATITNGQHHHNNAVDEEQTRADRVADVIPFQGYRIKGKNLTPEQIMQLKKLMDKMHGSIYFGFNQFNIDNNYYPILEKHAAFMKETHSDIIIQGHTDEKGSREYNVSLGQKRAENVKHALMAIGISPDNIEAVSLGEEKATGDDKSDRRADIIYNTEE